MKTLYKIVVFLIVAGAIFTMVHIHARNTKVVDTQYYNRYFMVATFKNGKVALLSKQHTGTRQISSPKVDEIFQPGDDSLSVFLSNEKYGFLNNHNGAIAINADFDKAWDFEVQSGYAAVVQNSKIGFINHSGNYVINPRYKYDEQFYFDDIKFSEGFCIIPDGKGKVGVINAKNELVLAAIYTGIEESIHGYKIIQLNEQQYGLADSQFKIVISPRYDYIALNHQGIVVADYKNHRQSMLAYDYKTVITEYAFDGIEKIIIDDGNFDSESELEYASDWESGYSKFTINGKAGVINDKTGKIIIPANWDDILYHSEGVFSAQLGDTYFLINIKGEIIN